MDLVARIAAFVRLRLPLLVACAFSAMLVACGGGGGDDAPAAPSSTVSGTAATGAAVANAVVILKDSGNRSVRATTSASGAFTLDTTGLAPPFLLRVTTGGGVRLLSVSTDGNATATLNITPITDLVVRSWYNLQGQSADTAFADPTALPPPAPQQVRSIARALLDVLQLAITTADAPVTDPLDLIRKPFAADGTGMDKLLDNSDVTVNRTRAELVLAAGSATQSTRLDFLTATSAITASTSTTDGTATTTATSTSVVAVAPGQVAALDAIQASLAGVAAAVNSRGTALSAADLEPFFDADLLDEGLNRSQFLAELLPDLRQLDDVTLAANQVRALDVAGGTAEVLVEVTQAAGGATSTDRHVFFFRKGSDGAWRFSGDGRIARVNVQAEGRHDQGLHAGIDGPAVNIDVRPVVGSVPASAASVSVTSSFASPAVQLGPVEVLDSGVQLQPFFANTGVLSPPLPAAGTPVTVTLQRSAGGSLSYTVPLNAFTTERIAITRPTGTTIPVGTSTVRWTLPTTYAVERIQVAVLMFTDDSGTGGFQCIKDVPVVSPAATSAQVVVEATCNGLPVRLVNLDVSTDGFNGERSIVIYGLSVAP